MRGLNSKAALLSLLVPSLLLLSADLTQAGPKKCKTPAGTVTIDPGSMAEPKRAVEILPDIIERYAQPLQAQDSCGYESLVDFLPDCEGGDTNFSGDAKFACGNPSKFIGHVCDDKFRKTEAKRNSQGVADDDSPDDLEIKQYIAEMVGEKSKKQAEDIYKDIYMGQNFEDPSKVKPFEQLLKEAGATGLLNPKTKEKIFAKEAWGEFNAIKARREGEPGYGPKFDSKINASITNPDGKYAKAAREIFEGDGGENKGAKGEMRDGLIAMKEQLLNQLAESLKPEVLDRATNKSAQLIEASFQKMIAQLDKAKLTIDNGDICMKGQKNTLVTRSPGGNMNVVVCPATLMSTNKGELLGSFTRALSHSFDSCAMDSLTVDQPAPPAPVSAAGLLEPLRACVGSKISQSTGQKEEKIASSMPEITPTVPWDPNYAAKAAKVAAPYSTMNPTPHCNKPLTGDELSKYSAVNDGNDDDISVLRKIKQRDQSNDAVAQFFATKGLATKLKKTSDKNVKAGLLRNAFAPFCAQRYRARGSHPEAKKLMEMVATDPDLLEAMDCKKEAADERAKASKLSLGYLKNGRGDGPLKLDKAGGASCEGHLAGGFGEYMKHMNLTGTLATSGSVGAGGLGGKVPGIEVSGAGGTGSPDGSAVQGPSPVPVPPPALDGAGSANNQAAVVVPPPAPPGVTPGGVGEGAATYWPTNMLSQRKAALEQAKKDARGECQGKALSRAQEKEHLRKACLGSAAKAESTPTYSPWGNKTLVRSSGDFSFEFGCQIECSCATAIDNGWDFSAETGAGACGSPELVYVGDKSERNVTDWTTAAVAADIAQYTDRSKEHGEHSVAAKACLKNPPQVDNPKYQQACDEPMGSPLLDGDGDAIIQGDNPITLIGETSGAKMNFGCEYRCTCGFLNKGRCTVVVQPPKAAAVIASGKKATAQEVADAKAGKRIDGNLAVFNALRSVSVSGSSGPEAVKGDKVVASGGEAARAITFDKKDPSFVRTAANVPADPALSSHLAIRESYLAESQKECEAEATKRYGDEKVKLEKDKKPVPELNAYYCPQADKTTLSTFKPGMLPGKGGSDSQYFYLCSYDCSKGKAVARFQSEVPPASSLVDLTTQDGREKARAADWEKLKASANAICSKNAGLSSLSAADIASLPTASGYGSPKWVTEYQANNLEACTKQAGKEKKAVSYEHVTPTPWMTSENGPYTGAPLPYSCQYTCNCGEKGAGGLTPDQPAYRPNCTSDGAVPYTLKNGSMVDYARVMSVGKKVQDSFASEAEKTAYQGVANSACEKVAVCSATGAAPAVNATIPIADGRDVRVGCNVTCTCTGGACKVAKVVVGPPSAKAGSSIALSSSGGILPQVADAGPGVVPLKAPPPDAPAIAGPAPASEVALPPIKVMIDLCAGYPPPTDANEAASFYTKDSLEAFNTACKGSKASDTPVALFGTKEQTLFNEANQPAAVFNCGYRCNCGQLNACTSINTPGGLPPVGNLRRPGEKLAVKTMKCECHPKNFDDLSKTFCHPAGTDLGPDHPAGLIVELEGSKCEADAARIEAAVQGKTSCHCHLDGQKDLANPFCHKFLTGTKHTPGNYLDLSCDDGSLDCTKAPCVFTEKGKKDKKEQLTLAEGYSAIAAKACTTKAMTAKYTAALGSDKYKGKCSTKDQVEKVLGSGEEKTTYPATKDETTKDEKFGQTVANGAFDVSCEYDVTCKNGVLSVRKRSYSALSKDGATVKLADQAASAAAVPAPPPAPPAQPANSIATVQATGPKGTSYNETTSDPKAFLAKQEAYEQEKAWVRTQVPVEEKCSASALASNLSSWNEQCSKGQTPGGTYPVGTVDGTSGQWDVGCRVYGSCKDKKFDPKSFKPTLSMTGPMDANGCQLMVNIGESTVRKDKTYELMPLKAGMEEGNCFYKCGKAFVPGSKGKATVVGQASCELTNSALPPPKAPPPAVAPAVAPNASGGLTYPVPTKPEEVSKRFTEVRALREKVKLLEKYKACDPKSPNFHANYKDFAMNFATDCQENKKLDVTRRAFEVTVPASEVEGATTDHTFTCNVEAPCTVAEDKKTRTFNEKKIKAKPEGVPVPSDANGCKVVMTLSEVKSDYTVDNCKYKCFELAKKDQVAGIISQCALVESTHK